jgi:hypothetical protein
MSLEQTQKFCKICNGYELHARPATNHLLHLLITIFLCGFWIPIWILSSLKFGGWRCQKCGTKQSEKALVLCFIAILLVMGLAFWNLFFNNPKPHLPDSPNVPQGQSNPPAPTPRASGQAPTDLPTPTPAPAPVPTPEPEPEPFVSPYLKSLEGIPLPVTLVVDEAFQLLDATGKEVLITEGKKILVTKRTEGGTLTMTIDGKLYAGNETRLAEKVRKDEK